MRMHKTDTILTITDPVFGTYIGAILLILVGIMFSFFASLCKGYKDVRPFHNLSILSAIVAIASGLILMTRRRFIFYKGTRRCDWIIYYFGFLKSTGSGDITDLDIIERQSEGAGIAYRIELRRSDQVKSRYPWLNRVISIYAWRKGVVIGILGKVDSDKARAIYIAKEIAEFSGIRAWDCNGHIIYNPEAVHS